MSKLLLSIILLLYPFYRLEQSKDVPLKLARVISLPGVAGRIDHLAYNEKQGLVYVAALGNNSVEVADINNKRVIYSIKGLNEPQGIRYIPETNSIVVANGGNGEIKVFDASTCQEIKSVKLGEDADNVRYDPASKTVYVGYGGGAIAAFDAVTLKQIRNIELPGHPESFQPDGESRLYVNVPDAHLLEVIDLKQDKVTEEWEVREATANFPMALDKENNRLFIGCRHPAKLLVLDAGTGKTIAALDADNDTDDIFYNGSAHQIYMSCGSGFVDIFNQISPDIYSQTGRVESGSGARTSLFIPELNQLVVAVPARYGNEARLMVYSIR